MQQKLWDADLQDDRISRCDQDHPPYSENPRPILRMMALRNMTHDAHLTILPS